MRFYGKIQYGMLPFIDGRAADAADPSVSGEWRVFENIDAIDSFAWSANDSESFEAALTGAQRRLRQLRRTEKDFYVLQGEYDRPHLETLDFFQLQIRKCHARIRIAMRFDPNNEETKRFREKNYRERDHFLWAWRQAHRTRTR